MAEMTWRDLARHLAVAAAQTPAAIHRGLEDAGRIVEEEARGMLGEYQPATPPFPRWADLKDATLRDRLRQGYSANEPLLRSGEMRDTIHHERKGDTVFVFSRSPIAPHHEFGTSKMPPRPFLGPAMVKKLDDAGKAIAERAFAPLMGRRS
jgi:hypothetical protein